ncbi:MAG: hypothetical protein EPN97_12860 [Alphaproteobacteria bacterium]|nr:MAG: hypothetical protein EPN97_12860 [Alphaproteobacteria bacterium]
MPFDSQDFELMKSLRKAVRETGEATAAKLEQLRLQNEKQLANDERLIEAFNRMSRAVEQLAHEVRELREDLKPSIDKPRRLPPPAQ